MILLDFRPCDIALALNVTEAFVSKWKILSFKGGMDVFTVKYHGSHGYFTSDNHAFRAQHPMKMVHLYYALASRSRFL